MEGERGTQRLQTDGSWISLCLGFLPSVLLLDQLAFSHPLTHSRGRSDWRKQRPGNQKDQGPVGKRPDGVCVWEAHSEGGGEAGSAVGEF